MHDVIEYSGHAVNESLSKGRSSGQLVISDGYVHFTCDETSISFPLDDAVFKQGGASDRLIFISHASHPQWTLYTSDRAILNNPQLLAIPPVAAQLKKAKKTHHFNRLLLVVVIVSVGVLPVSLLMSMDRITGVLAKQVPAEWETKLGKTVFDQYKISSHLMDDSQTQDVLMPVANALLAQVDQQDYQYHLHIANNPEINAFALPGGFIVINSGLILKAETPEEVLGVLAHEISHVTQQHSIRNIMSSAGIYLIVDALLGDVTGVLALITDAAPLLLNQSYSRDFETEADQKGYELLVKSNIDPMGMAVFFEKIQQEKEMRLEDIEDEKTRKLYELSEGLLSTHPATEDRIKSIKDMAAAHRGKYINLDQSFIALKSAVEQFVVETKEQELNEDRN